MIAFPPLPKLVPTEMPELMVDVPGSPPVGVAQLHLMREAELIVSDDASIGAGHGPSRSETAVGESPTDSSWRHKARAIRPRLALQSTLEIVGWH